MNLYLTADQIGIQTGGGLVTHHESEALRELGPCEVWGREQLENQCWLAPWKYDAAALAIARIVYEGVAAVPCPPEQTAVCFAKPEARGSYGLCHVYAGTFGETISYLRSRGCKVTYTAAAHDVAVSRQAHLDAGLPYDYPHLTEPALLDRYLRGYREADVLACPSRHSEAVMRGFGCTQRIEVIPHGVNLPKQPPAPLPERFTVGYLGAYGPDKSVKTLLQAWKKLNYPDATLVLAGRDSMNPYVVQQCREYGGGHIQLRGWVPDVADFYNSLSLYVQPSVTEGFGCEVLEAMAHGRPVVCSSGAGAADVAPPALRFAAGNVDELADLIDFCKQGEAEQSAPFMRPKAEQFTWNKIRQRYQTLWRELLA